MEDNQDNLSIGGGVGSMDDFFDIDSLLSEEDLKTPEQEEGGLLGSLVEDVSGTEEDELTIDILVDEKDQVQGENQDVEKPKLEISEGELAVDEDSNTGTDGDKDTDQTDKGKIPDTHYYKELAKELIASGVWEEIDAFESEDGEIPFEDAEIDKNTFIELQQYNIQRIKESAEQDKIDVSGVSEFGKKLIEIERNGGNVSDLVNLYQEVKNPIERLDLTKESDQSLAVYYKFAARGLKEDEIVEIIKGYKSSGTLSDKAHQSVNELNQAFDAKVEQERQAAEYRKMQEVESLKKYRKELGESLKKFEINSNYRRTLIDVATTQVNGGRFKVDELYEETIKDPQKAADLIMFLTNKEDYLKAALDETLTETKKTMFKIRGIIPKGKTSPITSTERKEKGNDKTFLDLESLLE